MTPNTGRPPSPDPLVTVHIQCISPCPTCNNHLAPYDIHQSKLIRNSRKLKRCLERDSPESSQAARVRADSASIASIHSWVELQHAGLGFTCHILESMVRTWRAGWHDRVSPRMKSFDELKELSRALWHYGCSPRPFLAFAKAVYDKHDRSHIQRHAQDWILIAIVFEELRDVFGYSAMELTGLGIDNTLPPHPAAGRFQISYQETVPRYIIEPQVYLWHRTMAFHFVRDAYGNLADDQSTESISKSLKEYFDEKGLRVLLPENEYRNQYFLRSNSPADLLRLFKAFLKNSINEANLRANPPAFSPQGFRMHKRKPSKSVQIQVAREIEILIDQLEGLEEWKERNFGDMLKNYPALQQRLNYCRSRQLILTHLTAPVMLPELQGRMSPVELPPVERRR